MNLKKALSEKGKDRVTLNLWILGITATFIIFILMIDGPTEPREQHRRTPIETEVVIERGADIDSYLNDDQFIDPVVGLIRGDGYKCNSISSIKVYSHTHPVRIRVVCNKGRDKYRIRIDSGNISQVERY